MALPVSGGFETPLCPFFGRCGGCQYQNISYAEELKLKEVSLQAALQEVPGLTAGHFCSIVSSPRVYHYRHRLDLKLLQRRDHSVHIGFSPVGNGPVLEVEACPIAMKAVSDFIPVLRREACERIPPKYRMASLVVRCGDGPAVRWGGIGRKSTKLLEEEYLYTEILGKRIFYSLNTFFQANLSILPALANALRGMDIWDDHAVFFDLYGGVGLLGLLVHDLAARVVNIEENEHAIRLARYNMMQNKAANLEIYPGRIEVVLPQLMARIPVERGILMVDPPRAGLSPAALALLNGMGRAGHLLYLSCSPESLARDLAVLHDGWSICSVRPFDFFPRTRHVETLVHLSRNKG